MYEQSGIIGAVAVSSMSLLDDQFIVHSVGSRLQSKQHFKLIMQNAGGKKVNIKFPF